MKFNFFLLLLFVLICKSKSQYKILNSLNEINKDEFINEDYYNYLMYGESKEFNNVLSKDKVYKHLIDKNSDFPLDSLIGLNTKDFIDENVSENEINVQMRSNKLAKNNFKTKDTNFNNKDARNYLNSLKKININELKKILRAVLIYTRSPSFELINAFHFFKETLNKIFKTLDLSTLFFEFENGIHTRVSCIVCMVISNFFKSPVFYHISAEKIINGLCYLKLPNEKICNLMADNFGKTLEFIRRNSKLTVEETCGALLGNQCLGDSTPKLNWTISLPILVNKNYRDLIDVNQNVLKTKENTIFVGQLTDVHVDPFYKVLANATCKEPVCCRKQLFDRTKLQINNIFKQLSSNDFHLPFTSNLDEKIFKDNFFINSTLNSILAHDLKNISVNFKNLTLNFGKRIVEIASIAGIWGDYNDCDTPTITFDLVLDSLKKFKIGNFKSIDLNKISLNYSDAKKIIKKNNSQPLDYVMWNGDIPPHDFWHYTKSYITNYIKESTRRISKHLKDVPVIPVLGNHEAVPINAFSPDFNDLSGLRYEIDSTQYFFNKTTRKMQFTSLNILKNQSLKKLETVKIDPLLTSNWLYQTAAENWATWLPDSALETVRLTGSYVIEKNENLRLIILNTNYCARINFWTWYDTVDPGNQLKFLVKELYEAENKNQFVHIIGHVPPDHLECTQAWLENYLKIIHRFKHVIRAQFFGHTHRDEYRVYYGSLSHQKNIFNELGLKGSGLEKLYERDLAKIGPVKPSPTYTPVTSATSSTLSKLKKSIEKIRNSLKDYSINWKPEEQIKFNKIIKNKLSSLVSINDKEINLKANDDKNSFDHTVAGFAFVAPSVTSYSKTNPAYRVYAVNDNTGYVLDYNTFFFNLTEAKIQSLKGINYEPIWELEYSARKEYKDYLARDQGQFTEFSLHLLQQKINNDEKEFDKFYRKFYVQSDAKEAISFDQTKKKLVLQNMMIRDPLNVWPFKIDQL